MSEVGFGSGSPIPGVVDLVVLQGRLYASVDWDGATGQVWRSTEGTNSEPVTTDGFEQELVTETGNGNLIIRNLLVKDYPIILRLIP